MSGALSVLVIAALAVVAATASLVTAALLRWLDRGLDRVHPAAALRIWIAAAYVPLMLGTFVVGVTLSPALGLVRDHCLAHGPHHPHLCINHATHLPAGIVVFACAVAIRIGGEWMRCARNARRMRAVRRSLDAASDAAWGGIRTVPGSVPWAVVAGFWSPRIYASERLLTDGDATLVLSHERAHVEGRHGLWRWLASVALAFHLPGVDRRLERRIALAQEMAADRRAAAVIGDGPRVAGALLRLARAGGPGGAPAMGFVHAAHLEKRVSALLAAAKPRPIPARTVVAMVGLAAMGATVGYAEFLHHALETVLGYLGG